MSRSATLALVVLLVSALSTAVAVLFNPVIARAQTNVDAAADAMCNPIVVGCACGFVINPKGGCMKGPNMLGCPCYGPHTSGICVAANRCLAQTFVGQAGQSGGSVGMQQLMSALQGLMSSLQGGGGGGGSGSGGSYSTSGSAGCTTFYQTSDPNSTDPCSYYVPAATIPTDTFTIPNYGSPNSTLPQIPGFQNTGCSTYSPTSDPNNSDPCTYYVPSGLGGGNNNGSSTNSSGSNSNNSYNPPNTGVSSTGGGNGQTTGSNTNITVNVPTQGQGFFSSVLDKIVGMHGAGGDIQVGPNGETIYAGQSNQQTNTSVAGFFGGGGTQSLGLVGKLCASRPWAHSFVSFLIPATFFDNLCAARGYGIGPQTNTSGTPQLITTQPQISVQSSQQGQAQNQVMNYPAPQADIWAAPSSVPIGGRTSIFWNSRNVQSCIVTSPDGSFNETTVSGGASTVPIVKTTIYTISCIAPDGSHVTNSVPVTINI